MAKLWATPDTAVSNDHESPETFFARKLHHATKEIAPTRAGVPLAMQAKLWPTPLANDHTDTEAASTWQQRKGHTGAGLPLAVAAKLWPTPTTQDAASSGVQANWTKESGRHSGTTLTDGARGHLRRLDDSTTRPATPTASTSPTPGEPTSTSGLRLNPRFVEALQGLPIGWVSCAPLGTAFTLSPLRSRSAAFFFEP